MKKNTLILTMFLALCSFSAYAAGEKLTIVSAESSVGHYTLESGYDTDNAYDGDVKSVFLTPEAPKAGFTFTVSLAEAKNIGDVKITFADTDLATDGTVVEVSLNKEDWTEIGTFNGVDYKASTITLNAKENLAQYVRLRFTQESSKDWFRIAEFEVYEAECGNYYRVAYEVSEVEGEVASTTEYMIAPSTVENYDRSSSWIYKKENNLAALTLTATNSDDGTAVKGINKINDEQTRLYAYTMSTFNDNGSECQSIKYTLSVSEDYVITKYSFEYSLNSTSNPSTITTASGALQVPSDTKWHPLSEKLARPAQSVYFTISTTKKNEGANYYIKNFIVTVQNANDTGNVNTVRYYVQSDAVTANAMPLNENSGASSIFYFGNDCMLSYSTGRYVKESGTVCGLQDYGVENAGAVTVKAQNGKNVIAVPNYLHMSENGGTYYVSHCENNNCGVSHEFVLEKVTALPVTISAAGYATLYAPVALEVAEGITAYSVAVDGEWATLNKIESGVIPANTGVVLAGDNGEAAIPGTYEFTITTTDATVESALTGTVAATYVTDDACVLANGENGVGFYGATFNQDNNTAFLNKSHKAYLPISAPAEAVGYSFRFEGGNTTAVEKVEVENEVEEIYDLQGRRIDEITKPGIYVVNGNKVLVK